MCMMWKNRNATGEEEVSNEDIMKFVTELGHFSDDSVLFNLVGGEPFLRAGITDVVKVIHDNKFSSSITTNGYLLDENMVKKVADSGLTSMFLSLDTLDAGTQDFLRGVEGSWKKVMKAIEHLDRFCPDMHLGINTVISGKNIEGLIELVEWVNKERRVDCIYFMAVMQPYETPRDREWYRNDKYSFLWPSKDGSLDEVMDELIALKKSGAKIVNSVSQLDVFRSYFKEPSKFVKRRSCNLGYSSVFVNVQGEMYLCFNHDCLGNIKRDNLGELWLSSKANRIRSEIELCRENCELLINCHYEDEE